MVKGLYTAYTGMLNEQNRMDILTNNLANADTTGFKKEGATSQSFKDVLTYKIKDASESPNLATLSGVSNLGVKIGENYTDYSQGSFKVTDNTYDLAISGSGFFTIQFTDKEGNTSTKYTRDGSFTLNKDGYLVTKDGDYVLNSSNSKIKLNPLATTSIDSEGNIAQNGRTVSKIKLTDFEDTDYLQHYGENYYETVDGYKTKQTDATIQSGYLEASNVSVVQEMVEMIKTSRSYESNQKMIQTFDSTLQIASSQLGKV